MRVSQQVDLEPDYVKSRRTRDVTQGVVHAGAPPPVMQYRGAQESESQ